MLWLGGEQKTSSPSAAHLADLPQLDQAVRAPRDQEAVQGVHRQGPAAQAVHVLHAVLHRACTQALDPIRACDGPSWRRAVVTLSPWVASSAQGFRKPHSGCVGGCWAAC